MKQVGPLPSAVVTTLLAQRSQFHQSNLVSHINVWDPETSSRLGQWARHFAQLGAGLLLGVGREGCDPVFLLTDAADWPQKLYGRLGFSPIGQLYEFLKLPLGTGRA